MQDVINFLSNYFKVSTIIELVGAIIAGVIFLMYTQNRLSKIKNLAKVIGTDIQAGVAKSLAEVLDLDKLTVGVSETEKVKIVKKVLNNKQKRFDRQLALARMGVILITFILVLLILSSVLKSEKPSEHYAQPTLGLIAKIKLEDVSAVDVGYDPSLKNIVFRFKIIPSSKDQFVPLKNKGDLILENFDGADKVFPFTLNFDEEGIKPQVPSFVVLDGIISKDIFNKFLKSEYNAKCILYYDSDIIPTDVKFTSEPFTIKKDIFSGETAFVPEIDQRNVIKIKREIWSRLEGARLILISYEKRGFIPIKQRQSLFLTEVVSKLNTPGDNNSVSEFKEENFRSLLGKLTDAAPLEKDSVTSIIKIFVRLDRERQESALDTTLAFNDALKKANKYIDQLQKKISF